MAFFPIGEPCVLRPFLFHYDGDNGKPLNKPRQSSIHIYTCAHSRCFTSKMSRKEESTDNGSLPPLLMNTLPPIDLSGSNNSNVALLALQSLLYEGTPLEIATRLWTAASTQLASGATLTIPALKEIQKMLHEASAQELNQADNPGNLRDNIHFAQARVDFHLENYGYAIKHLSLVTDPLCLDVPVLFYEIYVQSLEKVGKCTEALSVLSSVPSSMFIPSDSLLQGADARINSTIQSILKAKEKAKPVQDQVSLESKRNSMYQKRNLSLLSTQQSASIISSYAPILLTSIPSPYIHTIELNIEWSLIFFYPPYQQFDILTHMSEHLVSLHDCIQLTLSHDNPPEWDKELSLYSNHNSISISYLQCITDSTSPMKWIQIPRPLWNVPLLSVFKHVKSMAAPFDYLLFTINTLTKATHA